MVEKSHTAGALPNIYEPLRNIGQKIADWFAPRSEASAAEDYYEIIVEIPGVKAEDVDVAVHDGSLVVSGEKRSEHHESGRTYFFSEREYGAFQRSFRLPPDADNNTIDATFGDGVLTLRIAKRSSAPDDRRRIEVRQV
ncbi:MAG: Hsp20/alpha crystallin family protein [Hyphomicrobiaceae bacterium]